MATGKASPFKSKETCVLRVCLLYLSRAGFSVVSFYVPSVRVSRFFECSFVIVMAAPLVVRVSNGSSMFDTLPVYERDVIRIRDVLTPGFVATEIRTYLESKTGSLPNEDLCALSRALATEKESDMKKWFRSVKAKLDSTDPMTAIVGPTPNVMAAPKVTKDGSPRKVSKSRNANKKTVRFADEDKETLIPVMRMGNKIRSGFTKLASFIASIVECVDNFYVLHRKAPTDVLKNRYTCVAVLLLLLCLMYFVVLPTVVLAPTQLVYGVVADFCSQEFGFSWTSFTPDSEVSRQKPLISDGGEGENGKILSDYQETKLMEDDLSAMRAGLAGKASSSIVSDTNPTQETLSMYMDTISGFEKEYGSPKPMGEFSVTPSAKPLKLKTGPFVAHGRFEFPLLKEHMPGCDPEVVALQKKVADLEDRLQRVVSVLEETLAKEKDAADKRILEEEEHSRLNWTFGAAMGVMVGAAMVVVGRPVVAHVLAQATTVCMGFWAWGSISVTDLFTLGSFIFIDSVDDIDFYV